MSVTTYGFSAFLKLVNSSAKRQRSLVKERLKPSKGYDFHKAMRKICHDHLVNGVSFDESLAVAEVIVQVAERKSALAAIHRLAEWRREYDGPILGLPDRAYESPLGLFKVRFTCDFVSTIGGERIAVHLWNTKQPVLDTRLTRAALALFPGLYDEEAPEDFAVLSLRNSQLIRLGNRAEPSMIAPKMIEALEEVFLDIRSEGSRPEGRPSSPSPH